MTAFLKGLSFNLLTKQMFTESLFYILTKEIFVECLLYTVGCVRNILVCTVNEVTDT